MSYCSDQDLNIEALEALDCFHPSLVRHLAEGILLQNGQDGTYLLRPSSKPGEYALSVKCDQSVKHFSIVLSEGIIIFGHATFKSIDKFVEHFQNKPLIGTESSQLVLLKVPYPRNVVEPSFYDKVSMHAEFTTAEDTDTDLSFSLNTKEGFLTKLGEYFRTWKTRWFVLRRHELMYFKERCSKTAVRTLDLRECLECAEEKVCHQDKPHLFRVVFRWRTFYIYSTSSQDMWEWVNRINWCLKQNQDN